MSPEAKEHLLELRQKIDKIDLELLNALNQRAKKVMEDFGKTDLAKASESNTGDDLLDMMDDMDDL